MSLLGPVRWRDILDRPWWTWADVTGVSPLRVLLEGDDEETQVPAGNTLVAGLVVGDRVWCQVTGRQIVILGRAGG